MNCGMFSKIKFKVSEIAVVSIAFIAGVLLTLRIKESPKTHNLETSDTKMRSQSTDNLTTDLHSGKNRPEKRNGSPDQLMTPEISLPMIPEGIEDLIGNTPLFKIKSLSEATGCMILAKAEFLNGAGGSPKDRVALNMIRTAEEQGLLKPGRGDTIYEGTVGSTGISLASLARALGYNAHICMPNDQSQEKLESLLFLGAQVERVMPAPITSPEHYVNLARRRAMEHNEAGSESKGYFADQFENKANFKAHFSSTGPEIWKQTGGKIDAFVAGAGTGGTLSGVALYLKQKMNLGEKILVVLADPDGSGLYNKVKHGVMFSNTEREGTRRRHQVDTIVEGIGINRLTDNFEAGMEFIDDSVKVNDLQAMKMARWLVEKDGSSSAVNCVAAVVTALKMPKESRIVTVLCDSGNRHLSKFWKKIAELEPGEEHQGTELLEMLGIFDKIKRKEVSGETLT
ncbi:hypothetical protein Golomagni_03392 [Golovinomyces magnicellulatus]|nr:hypothetical protein Golomagni_03392 [Golovinomyces magnicellulatus]